MDCLIVSHQDNVAITSMEIEELLRKKPEQSTHHCIIKEATSKDVAKLAYLLQSATTVLPLLARAKSIAALTVEDKTLFEKLTKRKCTFAVRSIKNKEEKTSSSQLQEEVGKKIFSWITAIGGEPSVCLKNPELQFIIVADNNEYFIGIDVIGTELCKRPYKLYQHATSLNGCMAYALARFAGVTKKTLVVDPFCGTGTIPIEIALYQQGKSCFHFENKFLGSSMPVFNDAFTDMVNKQKALQKKAPAKKILVYGFDAQFKMMKGGQQNAKIAGVKDDVSFSKVNIDWIDAKFSSEEVDIIITQPPLISERIKNEKEVMKLYEELCHQAKYVLRKKTGVLAVFVLHAEKFKEVCKKHQFVIKKEHSITRGTSKFSLVLCSPQHF